MPFLVAGCINNASRSGDESLFKQELGQLKSYFQIPGLAVIVQKGDSVIYEDYLGVADIDRNILMDSTVTFPMASITKLFSGILVWQLEQEGKIELDEPLIKYNPDVDIPDSVMIEHALSHTSQGRVGKNYYYNNNRFMALGSVIENGLDQSFRSAIYNRIIDSLNLSNTYLLEDSAQLVRENRKIAEPYFLGGKQVDGFQSKETIRGFIDYGYSTAAGITSTVRDLAKVSQALDNGDLLTNESSRKMMSPYHPNLPYGLGVFSQDFMNERLVWGYGQYDCYSSLLLKVPDKDLVFVIAANNNLMSDPARLISGDVTYSMFALSFLKNFVFDYGDVPLIEDEVSLENLSERINSENQAIYRKKLMAQAVASSFMGRYDDSEVLVSKSILRHLFEIFPDYGRYGDLVVMHNLIVLKSIDRESGKTEFIEFDNELEAIGRNLLKMDEFNPYANYYLGSYYLSKGGIDSTRFYYEKIINAPNFSSWWYTQIARNWLEKNPAI